MRLGYVLVVEYDNVLFVTYGKCILYIFVPRKYIQLNRALLYVYCHHIRVILIITHVSSTQLNP